MKPQGIEEITKAVHSMEFACKDIRYAYEHATMTECMILEGLSKTANELRARLERFQEAITKKESS